MESSNIAMDGLEPAIAGGVEHLDFVIIGGGPGGIVALKEMVAAGITRIALLEREARIGGLFARGYDERASSAGCRLHAAGGVPR